MSVVTALVALYPQLAGIDNPAVAERTGVR